MGITLDGGANSLFHEGGSAVIHEQADDYKTDLAGMLVTESPVERCSGKDSRHTVDSQSVRSHTNGLKSL